MVRFIDPTLITSIQTDGSQIHFNLQHDDGLYVNKSLTEIEQLLPEHMFARVHKSTIVNVRQVQRFKNGANNTLVLKDGTEISVSRRRKSDFMDRFLRL